MFWGLALTAGATLMLQIALTRVFSVTMWYHMSLVSVSMAMFGMTLGALLVHFRPAYFAPELTRLRCAWAGLAFALTTVLSSFFCLQFPMDVSLFGGAMILVWAAVAGLPFLFSGVAVCMCLIRQPEWAGRLYSADLAGAATGCLASVALLGVMDAPSALLAIAALAGLGALCFSWSLLGRLRTACAVLTVVLALSAGLNTQTQWLRLRYVLGLPYTTSDLRYQFWNVFSYITVSQPIGLAFYWGAGDKAPKDAKAETMLLLMDTRARTYVIENNGDWESLGWLRYDITNLAHALRPDGSVLVIGAGGGRDILSALLDSKGQRKVDAVEINPSTVRVLRDLERKFTNLLDQPNVRLNLAEARSWVAHNQEHYRVITIPLVDTSAASAGGAYALTENNLYTVEAFRIFLAHLEPGGVLSVSRWWEHGTYGQVHRLLGMASAALRAEGVPNPRPNILLARGDDLTTLLVSRQPFTPDDLTNFRKACAERGFEPLLDPEQGRPDLVKMVEDPNAGVPIVVDGLQIDLTTPTDDRPYYFHLYSLRNFFQKLSSRNVNSAPWDQQAMTILLALVLAVTVLWAISILVPAALSRGKGLNLASAGFFNLIGLGFMFFESAQMQRLSLFVGYPIYALTVVLFTLLLASSLGAYLVGRLGPGAVHRVAPIGLALLATLTVLGLGTPAVTSALAGGDDLQRLLVAACLVAPAGVVLGTMFPLGLMLSEHKTSLAWCWALNGAASTSAAVYAIALSICWGISLTYWTGVLCYVLAVGLLVLMSGQRTRQ